jgi:two-component sensor histidine kinase
LTEGDERRPIEPSAEEFCEKWASHFSTPRDKADFRVDLERVISARARKASPSSESAASVAHFDGLDKSLVAVAPVYAIAVYSDDNGDIVIRQERPKEDQAVIVPARHAHVVIEAIQRQSKGLLFTPAPGDVKLGHLTAEDPTAAWDAFERNASAMCIFDRHTLRCLAVNDAALRVYAYDREQFMRLSSNDLDDPDAERTPPVPGAPSPFMHHHEPRTHRRGTGETFLCDVVMQDVIFEGRSAVLMLTLERSGTTSVRQAASPAERQGEALEREVQHRVRNNLQGVVGLLRRLADRHTSVEPLLTKAIIQLQAVETIQALGAQHTRDGMSLARIVRGLVRLVERTTGVAVECDLDHPVADAIPVRGSDVIALSLVLNELLMNAVTHGASGSAVRVSARKHFQRAVIEISNRGELDKNFDLSQGVVLGDGLELVKVLLPSQGANLRYSSGSGDVQATLELTPPVFLDFPGKPEGR